MTALLLLGPAGLAACVAATALLGREGERTARGLCVVGSVFGIALFVAANDVSGWRTAGAAPLAGAVAGATGAVAWAVVAAGHRPRSDGVLAGVGASALALFAAAAWVVPALLFWACALFAITGLVGSAPGRHLARLFVVAGGAAVTGALGFAAWDAATWSFPAPDGALAWLALSGVLGVIGILPVAVWQVADGSASGAIPLSVGAGFVVLARVGAVDEPWIAVAVLGTALALAVGAWVTRLEVAVVGSWMAATLIGVALAAPATVVLAGSAGALAAGAITLWPNARGRGRISRGLLLSLAPPTVAFAGLVAAEARAFTRATTTVPPDVAWAAVATLLPLALGAGIVLGGVAARTPPTDDFEPRAVLVTWGLLGATLAIGMFGQAVLEVPPLIARSGSAVIYPAALGAGVLVASRVPGRARREEMIAETHATGVVQLSRWLGQLADLIALGLSVTTLVGIGWLTWRGFSVGFL